MNCGKEGFDVGARGALVVVGLPEIEDEVRDIWFGEALISIKGKEVKKLSIFVRFAFTDPIMSNPL